MAQEPTPDGRRRALVRLIAACTALPATVIIGVIAGRWLDSPDGIAWTLALGMTGLAIGLYQILRSLK